MMTPEEQVEILGARCAPDNMQEGMYGHALSRVPLTCGELVQGRLGGSDFLVTCPVEWWVQAAATVKPLPGCEKPEVQVKGAKNRNWDKTRGVLQQLLLGVFPTVEVQVEMESPGPVGKGLATSTADMVAALSAVARALGRELPPKELAALVLAVEPSDGIMYPGIVRFAHRAGNFKTLANPVPAGAYITMVDFGGTVDTLCFNRRDDLDWLNIKKASRVSEALEMVSRGLKEGDWFLVGKGATRSAFANQDIHYKPGLEELWNAAREAGALGIVAAHSGTVAGVIHFKTQEDTVKKLLGRFVEVDTLGTFRITGGGVREVEEER